MRAYWINTISREHVQRGVEGGFTQANHGRPTTLRKLARGDLVVFYSPRESYPNGAPLQRFTAIGRVIDDAPYQAEMTPEFHPWRRRMAFLSCDDAPIQDLIGSLAFIADPKRWGFPFRRGLFQIDEADFRRIADAMQAGVCQSETAKSVDAFSKTCSQSSMRAWNAPEFVLSKHTDTLNIAADPA